MTTSRSPKSNYYFIDYRNSKNKIHNTYIYRTFYKGKNLAKLKYFWFL